MLDILKPCTGRVGRWSSDELGGADRGNFTWGLYVKKKPRKVEYVKRNLEDSGIFYFISGPGVGLKPPDPCTWVPRVSIVLSRR